MENTLYYYVQTNLFCLLILAIVYISLRTRTSVLPSRRLAFSRLVFVCCFICFSDVFAWLLHGTTFSGSYWLLQVSNGIYYGAITWAAYDWLEYVNLRVGTLEQNYKRRRILPMIPLFVIIALLVSNPFTKFFFTIDEQGVYSRGNGVYLHWIISYGYLIYATGKVVYAMIKSKSKAEKRKLAPLIYFVIPPFFVAGLQMFVYGLTSTQCGMTVAVLIIYLTYLSQEVSTDSLTGLNNRKALENYLNGKIKEDNRMTFFMCDVDNFKSINDTFGHTAGDIVLTRIAESLQTVCSDSSYKPILCRYGGDEFVMCMDEITEEQCEEFSQKLQHFSSEANSMYNDKFTFSISVGYASGKCEEYSDTESLLALADTCMYEQKQKKKLKR